MYKRVCNIYLTGSFFVSKSLPAEFD